jgi:hypothetical protein
MVTPGFVRALVIPARGCGGVERAASSDHLPIGRCRRPRDDAEPLLRPVRITE